MRGLVLHLGRCLPDFLITLVWDARRYMRSRLLAQGSRAFKEACRSILTLHRPGSGPARAPQGHSLLLRDFRKVDDWASPARDCSVERPIERGDDDRDKSVQISTTRPMGQKSPN